jgi:hypothetical protein
VESSNRLMAIMAPRLTWNEATQTIYVDGRAISMSILAAVSNPDSRLLWRFRADGDSIIAVPYSEQSVIWLEEKFRQESKE